MGTEAITLTAPVSGSIATTEPPTLPVEAIALLSPSSATCWAPASSVSLMSAPARVVPESWSISEANSFCSPESSSFSDSSMPVRPTSTNE